MEGIPETRYLKGDEFKELVKDKIMNRKIEEEKKVVE